MAQARLPRRGTAIAVRGEVRGANPQWAEPLGTFFYYQLGQPVRGWSKCSCPLMAGKTPAFLLPMPQQSSIILP